MTLTASVNSHTQLYGIIGHPVGHSLSPQLHNALFGKLGLNAVYLAFDVDGPRLGFALEAVRTLGIKGLNVTVPHKETVLEFIDEIPEDLDRCVGAVNTIVNRDGRLFGYNTDVPGFLMALREELGFDPRGKKILVLGAGGAARAAVFALAWAGADAVTIHNRTPARAKGLEGYLATHFGDTDVRAVDAGEAAAGKVDLVVNATSLGLKAFDPPPFDLGSLKGKPAAYDIVYGRATKFLETAARLGLPHAGGGGMLAAQAAASFALWTGRKDGVRETLMETLKACTP
ncbi:MAG: shikimate dehydrogenase [Omnitrophica bacterium RIFCSPHIGHO2_02_FULL_63_14]|nr:MAG: shikimate dehydrogenase [Omnitrophica bacterium RIFCSPHIGHO2_02_FULL_63_14]